MKTSFWHNIPNPFAAAPPIDPPTLYPASAFETPMPTPTHLLYPQHPTSVRDIIGKGIGAPLYDNISAAVRRFTDRFRSAPATVNASVQEFAGTAPTIDQSRVTTKEVLTAGAIASAGIMACGADGDLSSVLTKAILFNLVGGLGLFLYGMKLMTDGMHAASGSAMKKVISTLTGNRFSALLVGAGTTAVIQSSSVTSVLALGLVESGLMTLTQALGIVAGANIGTTITGWFMASGFVKYGLPMLGASALTHLFSDNERVKSISKGILGLGMVFLGLTTMSAGFKDPVIKGHLESFFSTMSDPSVWGITKCMFWGALATAGIQSSSATTGITIGLAAQGIIPFEAAVGFVLGSNVGTTITAWLAALRTGVPKEARRVAIAHSLFNILGVLAILPWSPTVAKISKEMAYSIGLNDPALHVAFVHTLFNVSAAAVFLPLVNPFEKLVKTLTPDREAELAEAATYGQKRLSQALLKAKAPEFALEASHGVIADDMNPRVERMLNELLKIMTEKPPDDESEEAIRLGEQELDIYQAIVYDYLNHVEQMHLDHNAALTLDAQRHIASNLESISDHLLKLLIIRQKNPDVDLPPEATSYMAFIHQSTLEHFMMVGHAVAKNRRDVWSKVKVENEGLKRKILEHEEHFVQGSTQAQIFYNDAMGLYREILGNIKNIAEAIAGKK